MNYLIWDTERIKGSSIYMLAYILVNEKFEIIKKAKYGMAHVTIIKPII